MFAKFGIQIKQGENEPIQGQHTGRSPQDIFPVGLKRFGWFITVTIGEEKATEYKEYGNAHMKLIDESQQFRVYIGSPEFAVVI